MCIADSVDAQRVEQAKVKVKEQGMHYCTIKYKYMFVCAKSTSTVNTHKNHKSPFVYVELDWVSNLNTFFFYVGLKSDQ